MSQSSAYNFYVTVCCWTKCAVDTESCKVEDCKKCKSDNVHICDECDDGYYQTDAYECEGQMFVSQNYSRITL